MTTENMVKGHCPLSKGHDGNCGMFVDVPGVLQHEVPE